MHVLYVTAQTPWGPSEAFILPEIIELERQGHRVTVCPLRPQKKLAPGSEAAHVAKNSVYLPLLGCRTFLYAVKTLLWRPAASLRAVFQLLFGTDSMWKRAKNLAIVPKGLALAWLVRCLRPDHIHVHWASTPSSAAFIAANITGTPWSFTAHRWDIKERNALSLKIRSAVFARAISQKAAALLRNEIRGDEHSNVLCIHMGCRPDGSSHATLRDTKLFTGELADPPLIVCPANLLPVKGHKVLIKACSLLRNWGVQFRCLMFGQGPLEEELKSMTKQERLGEFIEWRGQIPHDELLALYGTGRVSVVVLPSIVTPDGEEEGIPVSLMEAMSAGIPVISTLTGNIPELLRDGAGLLVREKDANALAFAIRCLFEDRALYERVARLGRQRVVDEFSIEESVKTLVGAMSDLPGTTNCQHRPRNEQPMCSRPSEHDKLLSASATAYSEANEEYPAICRVEAVDRGALR